MVTGTLQRYLLGLIFATTLSANIQSASAVTTTLLNTVEAKATLLSTTQLTGFAVVPATTSKLITHAVELAKISADFNPSGQVSLILANKHQNIPDEKTSKTSTEPKLNPSNSKSSGSLVSTDYNTINMLRTMDDSRNIGYLGINDVNPETLSEALTRELKMTSNLAFLPHNSCFNGASLQLPPTCQGKNVEKTAPILIIHHQASPMQINKKLSF